MSSLHTTASELLSTGASSSSAELSWFAIQTFPRHEKKVAAEIQEKGIGTFLPLISAKHQWSDRQRLVEEAMFPGYAFVRMVQTLNNRVAILRTQGVARFVGIRGIGVPIPDEQIESVQAVLAQGIPFRPHSFPGVGRRVRIRGGSFDGVEGILTAVNGDQTLVISIEIIQRSLAIRVAGYQVERI
jgi:transcriptional antiterminator NusG